MAFIEGNNEIQRRKGRRHMILKVTLKMIAEAKGCHINTVRRAIEAGKLDVKDLKSIAKYILKPVDK